MVDALDSMGLTQSVHVEIEIKGSPEQVRAVALDFDSYPEWFEYWTYDMKGSTKPPLELQPPDRINYLDRLIFSFAISSLYSYSRRWCLLTIHRVQVNTPQSFQIRGSLAGKLLVGHHQIYFKPSETMPGCAKLVVHEDFIGLFSFKMRRGTSMWKELNFTFTNFVECVKKRVEDRA
ncbi:hypothetical protein BX600DRAFT_500264 [Xylariales sp. PMI_506]|nr:hypothetical protein BX600DRAFT_500264 [Xylariales sp. PMI_506]